jgi:monoamine oxidase
LYSRVWFFDSFLVYGIGGAVQLVRQLAQRIPQERLLLNTPITSVSRRRQQHHEEPPTPPTKEQTNNDQCATTTTTTTTSTTQDDHDTDTTTMKIRVETTTTTTTNDDKDNDNPTKETTTSTTTTVFWANHVIFCVPPKLLAKHVTFDPPLSQAKQLAMQQSNTWMAGVTKVALVYKTAFWKDDYQFQNILGRLVGPAFQIYDSSTDDVNALTAFCLVPTDENNHNNNNNNNYNDSDDNDKKLADKVARQLGQAFQYLHSISSTDLAKHATTYLEYHIQRWPLEKYISEDPSPTTIRPHPHPVKALSTMEWDGKLLFAGTETDVHSPGVMEGAIGSALRCIQQLSDQKRR